MAVNSVGKLSGLHGLCLVKAQDEPKQKNVLCQLNKQKNMTDNTKEGND